MEKNLTDGTLQFYLTQVGCNRIATNKNMIKKAYIKVHGSANYKTMQVCYRGNENFTQPLISKEYEILI